MFRFIEGNHILGLTANSLLGTAPTGNIRYQSLPVYLLKSFIYANAYRETARAFENSKYQKFSDYWNKTSFSNFWNFNFIQDYKMSSVSGMFKASGPSLPQGLQLYAPLTLIKGVDDANLSVDPFIINKLLTYIATSNEFFDSINSSTQQYIARKKLGEYVKPFNPCFIPESVLETLYDKKKEKK